jgi:hypothetical protein
LIVGAGDDIKNLNGKIEYMFFKAISGALTSVLLFAVAPTSTNYTLKAYDFGNGGGSTSSTSFSLNAITNGQAGNTVTSTTYLAQPGLAATINANVPPAPTFTNPSNYYDRLKIVLATGNNPTTTKYAIAISSNNFVTTQYIRSDNTVGSTLTAANYQTYALWGGASGFNVLGLQANTTYKIKVKAINGNFSETAYGPIATAATVNPSISFAVTTTLTSTPPFTAAFTSLPPGSVFAANADPQLALTTNALFGGVVYINDTNAGLKSTASSYTLASATADLGSVQKGYGAQVISTAQGAGGPITATAPYNGALDNVGALATSLQSILSTTSPVTSATATVRLKAKTDITVPSTSDYTDTITFTAAMLF